ncbi:MAG: hypothetical protein RR772_12605, partial [Gordonibacter sp.]
MEDLRILVARLGWPSTAARWWTMQELAARLGAPASKAAPEAALLEFPKLAESIPKTSILSELLLESFGLWADTPDEGLEEVPEDFEIPQDFNGVQGADLPRMFRTSMTGLEAATRLPFVRQMAFEWSMNKDAYPDAPFQGDPWHFSRPLGAGFSGQTSSRTALRMISAYHRTLAVAEAFWGMPPDTAEDRALLALP